MEETNKIQNILQIEQRIFTIRGLQVMLDSDLAEFFGVETKMVNRAVKRNPARFPKEFYFSLTAKESDLIAAQERSNNSPSLRCQNGTLKNNERGRHRKYSLKVFTEQGVAMLASVLRSETAVKMSVEIMKAFVAMRRFLVHHDHLFDRLARIDVKLYDTDKKIRQIFQALDCRSQLPETGLFFEGQVFDAWMFVSDLIRSADTSIVLIDNYIDETVLKLLAKRKPGVEISLFTRKITPQLSIEAEKFNRQYGGLEIRQLFNCHDRFLIIDQTSLYHIGASLKDLGKSWFAFSRIDTLLPSLQVRLKESKSL